MSKLSSALIPPLFVLAAALWSGINLGVRWDESWTHIDVAQSVLMHTRLWLTGLAGLVSAMLVWKGRRAPSSSRELLVGLSCVPLATILSTFAKLALMTGGVRWSSKTPFFCILLAGLVAWAAWLQLRKPDAPLERTSGIYLVIVGNIFFTLVAMEGLLALIAMTGISAFVQGSNAASEIDLRRPEPGTQFFGMPLNEGGYHDRAFFRASEQDLVVALLGDSFGFGIVPYERLFTTVAENRLRAAAGERFERVAIHNFSINAIGPWEYKRLLEEEALATEPKLVVVCLFVGNDISQARRDDPGMDRLYTLSKWRTWEFGRRVIKLVMEGRRSGASLGDDMATPVGASAGALALEYLDDTSLEEASFSEPAFLSIENDRLEVTRISRSNTRKDYAHLRTVLDAIHARLGERMMILIIPDEYQVDDTFFASLTEGKPDPSQYDQFFPQQEIHRYCDERGIPCVDPLDALRAANLQDRVYHLRNTHWNSRGNSIAGELLGDALRERLQDLGGLNQ